MSKTKLLKNLSWRVDGNGDVFLEARDKDDSEDDVVVLWSGSMRTNITFKTFAKQVIEDDVVIMVTRRSIDDNGDSIFQLGPMGSSAYGQLVHQGAIKEPKPFVAV